MRLVPLIEARRYIGADDHTQDAAIEVCLDAAQALVEQLADRTLASATRTETTRSASGDTLYLTHAPVTDVASVEVLGAPEGRTYTLQTLASLWTSPGPTGTPAEGDWTWEEGGSIRRHDGGTWVPGTRGVRVTYTAGYTVATLPADLRALILQLAAAMYARRGKEGVKSESIGSNYRVEYAGGETETGADLYGIPGAAAVIARYSHAHRMR